MNASDTRGKADASVVKGVGGKLANAVKELSTNLAVSYDQHGRRKKVSWRGGWASKVVGGRLNSLRVWSAGNLQHLLGPCRSAHPAECALPTWPATHPCAPCCPCTPACPPRPRSCAW